MIAARGDRHLDHYQRLFERRAGHNRTEHVSVDRQSLPSPLRYLTDSGLLTRKPRTEWAQIRCPSHKAGAETNPSMGVSLIDGHFKCHTCGAKGGDIIALHRLRTGLCFRNAVLDLGARFHDD